MAGIICPQCKANNKENARFCAECGAELGTARSSRSVPAPTGNRCRSVNRDENRHPQIKARWPKQRLRRSGFYKTATGSRNSWDGAALELSTAPGM